MTPHSDSMLALSPGRGLGAFKLGESLYSTLNQLRYNPILSTSSITVHGDNDAVRSNILIRLKPSTIDLYFDGVTQRLSSITIALPSISFDIIYNSKVIIQRNTTLSRTDAGILFGPCRTDSLDQWPGMKWCFIHAQSSSFTISANPIPILDGMIAEALIIPKKSVRFTFTGDDQSHHPIHISRSTAADVVALLGSPQQTFEKRDNRLGVYATKNHSSSSKGVFYNYPSFGVDILLNSISHTVEKIILHSNVPATPLFQAYNRCMWRISNDDKVNGNKYENGNGKQRGTDKQRDHGKQRENDKQIEFTDKIDTILSKLHNHAQVDKMVLDRAHEVGLREWDASMGMMELVSIDRLGVIMEVTRKGDVSNVCIHD